MKKNIKLFFIILIIFIVAGIIIHQLNRYVINYLRKLQRDEADIITFRLMGTLIFIVLTAISCLIAASLAKRKKRNPIIWVLISLFLNLWAVLVLYLLPYPKRHDLQEKSKPNLGGTKGFILLIP